MTKKEALERFRSEVLPNIVFLYGEDDKVARAEWWNNWTDTLCKDGHITVHQYETWTNPF